VAKISGKIVGALGRSGVRRVWGWGEGKAMEGRDQAFYAFENLSDEPHSGMKYDILAGLKN